MRTNRIITCLAITGVFFLVLLTACSGAANSQTPDANFTPAQSSFPTSTSTPVQYPEPPAGATGPEEAPETTPTPLLGELLVTRSPEPTATLSPFGEALEVYTARIGLATNKFLGISVANWINLLVSALIVLAGYLFGTWFIRVLLPRLAKRTSSTFDDDLLKSVGPDIRWVVTIFILDYASTDRLIFINATFKAFLKDIYFILTLFFILRITVKLIDLTSDWYLRHHTIDGRKELAPIIKMLNRVSRILIVFIGITILLSHFGVNVTALTAALGIGGLAISLAAKDTVSDAIAGVILLIDRPFRVGDRIEIQGVGTWGDVTDIGLRTTRIRTRDNRLVIVPNSIISNNQVINYTYPDPRYRIETHVDIAFGTDIETIRQLLIETVSNVDGVLEDKPVDALYVDMGGTAMKFRLRWWIRSYVDTRRMFDRVHTAIQYALDNAGIDMPNIASNINLQINQKTIDGLSQMNSSRSAEDDERD